MASPVSLKRQRPADENFIPEPKKNVMSNLAGKAIVLHQASAAAPHPSPKAERSPLKMLQAQQKENLSHLFAAMTVSRK